MFQPNIELILLGLILIIVGTLLLAIGAISFSFKEMKESESKIGGVIIIGPVVIPFGYFSKYYKYFIPIAIILLIIFIYFLVKR